MKSIILLAIVFAVNAAPKSPTLIHPKDASNTNINSRIVFGINANTGQFPSQAKIYFKDQFICSGSILNHRFILTAAHCIGEPVEFYKIFIASNSIHRGDEYKVAETIPHENYGNFVNDIGLVYTASWMFYISIEYDPKPIDLTTFYPGYNQNECWYVSGWGGDSPEGGDYSSTLKYLCPKIEEQSDCERLTGVSHPGTFCMNGVICQGDSGAPVTRNSTIFGVANFIVGGCRSGFPDGYANVFYYKDWIERTMDLYEINMFEQEK